jgi:hypothetical protein
MNKEQLLKNIREIFGEDVPDDKLEKMAQLVGTSPSSLRQKPMKPHSQAKQILDQEDNLKTRLSMMVAAAVLLDPSVLSASEEYQVLFSDAISTDDGRLSLLSIAAVATHGITNKGVNAKMYELLEIEAPLKTKSSKKEDDPHPLIDEFPTLPRVRPC